MDSLRYWVLEMHVDGFRFDLASALARELHDVDRLGSFFDIIQQDPVLQRVKLIAEPWDVGEGGYQVGNFPPMWSEWNGKYRDTVRDYWRGEQATLGEFAFRFTGQPTCTSRAAAGRSPASTSSPPTTASRYTTWSRTTRSTTRPTARTTATARATTARGTAAPRARPTTRASTPAARASSATSWPRCSSPRACRCCSPGDELGRTQQGNNNAYCQDNEISWFDWEHADADLARVHAAPDRAPPTPSGLPPARLVPGPADPRHRRQRHRLVQARRRADDRRGLGTGLREVARRLPQRPGADRARRPGQTASSTTASAPLQRAPRAARVPLPGPRLGPPLGRGARHARRRRATARRATPRG